MVSPSFVDQGPKSRVLIIAIGDCPEMAQIWLGGGKPPPATTSRCHMATLPFHDVEEVLVIFDTGWRCSSAVQHWMHWINSSSSFSGMLAFVFCLSPCICHCSCLFYLYYDYFHDLFPKLPHSPALPVASGEKVIQGMMGGSICDGYQHPHNFCQNA